MKRYIIVFDDGDSLCVPYGLDPDCEGAICSTSSGDVALFTDRKQAQQAICISTKYAELCKAQGIPVNSDFLGESRKCVKIRPVVEMKARGE